MGKERESRQTITMPSAFDSVQSGNRAPSRPSVPPVFNICALMPDSWRIPAVGFLHRTCRVWARMLVLRKREGKKGNWESPSRFFFWAFCFCPAGSCPDLRAAPPHLLSYCLSEGDGGCVCQIQLCIIVYIVLLFFKRIIIQVCFLFLFY